jgi:ketosteroid isomerase-like protein
MNEAFMRSYYEAYNSEDESRLGAFLADNVVLVSAQGEQRGKDAYLATYRFITANFRDQMTPDEITIDGDSAVVKITDRFEAKHEVADFLGRSFAKGDGFMLKLAGSYKVAGDKIATINIAILGME